MSALALVALLLAGMVQEPAAAQRKFPLFADSDADKDGTLSLAEWNASGRSPKRFARVDADRDGKVTREELRAATAADRAAAQTKP